MNDHYWTSKTSGGSGVRGNKKHSHLQNLSTSHWNKAHSASTPVNIHFAVTSHLTLILISFQNPVTFHWEIIPGKDMASNLQAPMNMTVWTFKLDQPKNILFKTC